MEAIETIMVQENRLELTMYIEKKSLVSFCSDEPDVRAHMYLFVLYRKVPATYIYIYIGICMMYSTMDYNNIH